MNTGLVLEGGAMRGTYTIGVLDVLMENKITFDGVLGVSAGAIHGASLVSGQNGRNIRYYKKYSSDKRFMSLYSFITTGDLVGKDFCYNAIPWELDLFDNETFKKSPIRFYAVVTNLETGKAEYIQLSDLKNHDEMEYLRASASMPIVSKIIEIRGKKYLDGGIADSIPLKAAENLGYTRNVVVATRTDGYVKKPEHIGLTRLLYRKYPKFIETTAKRADMYNSQKAYILESEKRGSIFFIRPSEELQISRTDTNPEHLEAVYQIGRKDAENVLPNLIEWMNGTVGCATHN